MSHRWCVDICLESVRICLLEVFKLCGPCKRTYDICIDAIGSPLGCCNSRQSSDTFLRCGVSTLSEVSEQTSTRCKIDYRAFRLLQIWIACFHIVKGCIQSRINRKVKLCGCMIGDRHTGSGSLRVIDQHVDSAKCIDCLLYNICHDCFIVRTGAYICLYRQYLHAIFAFDLFLCTVEFLHVSSGQDKVCAFLRIGSCDSISDRTAASVAQNRASTTCDNCYFTF